MIASSSTIAITTETSTSEKPACADSIVLVRRACVLRCSCRACELYEVCELCEVCGLCELCGIYGLCGICEVCQPFGPRISVPTYFKRISIVYPSLQTAGSINVQPRRIDSRCNDAERLLAGMEQCQRTTQVVDRAVMPQTDREHARHCGQQQAPAQYGRLPRHGDEDVPLHPGSTLPQTFHQAAGGNHVIQVPELRRVQQTRIEDGGIGTARVSASQHGLHVPCQPWRGTRQLERQRHAQAGRAMFVLAQRHGEQGQEAQRLHLPIDAPRTEGVDQLAKAARIALEGPCQPTCGRDETDGQ